MSRLIIDIADDPAGRQLARSIRARLIWHKERTGLMHYLKVALLAYAARVRVVELGETPPARPGGPVCCLCMVTERGEPRGIFTVINSQGVCQDPQHLEAAELCGGSYAKAAALARSMAGFPT